MVHILHKQMNKMKWNETKRKNEQTKIRDTVLKRNIREFVVWRKLEWRLLAVGWILNPALWILANDVYNQQLNSFEQAYKLK